MQGVLDPVCGMTVDPHTAKHRHEHRGHTYYFCSAGCRTKFAADPEKYLDKDARAAEPVPEGTIYTCPMHPEIRQVGPGSCPICGMALEPEIATADTGPNPELADMSRRFWIGLVLTLPVFALEMGAHIVGGHGFDRSEPVELDPVRIRDAGGAVGRMAVLRARLAIAAHAQSQHVHPDRDGHRRRVCLQRGRDASRPACFPPRSAAMAARSRPISRPPPSSPCWCCSARCWNCARATQTSGAIRALIDLAPKTARRVRDGAEEDVALDEVVVGDILRVRPGEKVPVDGIVTEGRSSLDESMVTGESMPVTKEAGAKVIAGTLNTTGSFLMRAEKVGRDTMLAQIVQMVASAQRSRAPIQRLADQVAALVRAAASSRSRCWPSRPGRCSGRSRALPMRWSRPSRC